MAKVIAVVAPGVGSAQNTGRGGRDKGLCREETTPPQARRAGQWRPIWQVQWLFATHMCRTGPDGPPQTSITTSLTSATYPRVGGNSKGKVPEINSARKVQRGVHT